MQGCSYLRLEPSKGGRLSGESHRVTSLSPHPLPPPTHPPPPARDSALEGHSRAIRTQLFQSDGSGSCRHPLACLVGQRRHATDGARITRREKTKRGQRPVRLTILRRWRRSLTTCSCRTSTHRWDGWEALRTTAKQADRRLDAVHSLSSSRMRGRCVGSTAKRRTPEPEAPATGALLEFDTHPHTRGSNGAAGGA